LRPTDKQNREWQFGQRFPPLLPTVTLKNLIEYIFLRLLGHKDENTATPIYLRSYNSRDIDNTPEDLNLQNQFIFWFQIQSFQWCSWSTPGCQEC